MRDYILASIISCVMIFSILSIHTCSEGHRCVYYRGGGLMIDISDPGYHLKFPLITQHYNVQTTWQTDKLNSVIRSTINYEFDRNLTAVSHEPKDALDVLGIRASLGDGIIDALNKYPKEYEKARALTVDYLNFIVEK